MVQDADCAVEGDDEGNDEEGETDYAEGFSPCEAWWLSLSDVEFISGSNMSRRTDCDDGGCKLPCRSAI